MMRKVAEPILIGSLFSSWKCRKQSKIERNSSNALLKEDNGSQNELKYEKNFHLNQPFDEFDSELKFKLVLKGIYNFASKLDPKKNIVEKSPSSLEKALKMLDCNNEWREKVRWSLTHFCDENDLNCEEEFSRRTSQDVRLNSLLIALNTIIENGYGEELIGQKVLSLLMDLCNLYEETHRNIFINCLKILSNIAVQNKNCAMAIANSEWLPKLATLAVSTKLDESLLAEKICMNAISTFDSTRQRFGTNIYELYRSDNAQLVDIVFIHGLKGSVFRTWREKNFIDETEQTLCWPRDWLPKDINAPCRILAIDYTTSLVHFAGVTETLAVRSQRISKQLRSAGVGDRPLMFICHSMGGLLAKRIMLDDERLRENTIGILFLATPHRGSPVANYASFALRPTNDLRILHHQNEINKDLHRDFLNIAEEIPVICSVAELEKVPLPFRQKEFLVPVESAYFEYGPIYHIKDVHYNICKPSSRNDTIYSIIIQFIYDVVNFLNQSKKASCNPRQR